jgi:protein-S-isoprenylcysteine O-methyltransferase Ste14
VPAPDRDAPRNPSGAVHPTAFLLAWAGLGLGLQRVAPLGIPDAPLVVTAATAITFLGVILFVWCVAVCAHHHTTLEHARPTTALVTTGPFRWSRNPMYVALVAVLLGLSVEYDNAWWVGGTVLFTLAVHRFTVLREETYLEGLFGDDYRRYRRSVRRWL